MHSRSKFVLRTATVAAGLQLGTTAWAHPGHGATEPGELVHYLVEPIHGWGLLLVAVLIAARFLHARLKTRQTAKESRKETLRRQ